VYSSIFEDKQILPLCRYIGSTANYFDNSFNSIQSKAAMLLNNDFMIKSRILKSLKTFL
jgi:hypothetical protein